MNSVQKIGQLASIEQSYCILSNRTWYKTGNYTAGIGWLQLNKTGYVTNIPGHIYFEEGRKIMQVVEACP